jgi:hypothetical protein
MTEVRRSGLECIDGPENCRGPVMMRWPGYGEQNWPRCEKHGAERVEREEGARERYPDTICPPSDFDPLDAGEAWGEDDY